MLIMPVVDIEVGEFNSSPLQLFLLIAIKKKLILTSLVKGGSVISF